MVMQGAGTQFEQLARETEDAEREARIAKAAATTAVVTKFWYYHPAERKAQAREALRRLANSESYKKEDGMADVFLEGLWNIMSGNNEG